MNDCECYFLNGYHRSRESSHPLSTSKSFILFPNYYLHFPKDLGSYLKHTDAWKCIVVPIERRSHVWKDGLRYRHTDNLPTLSPSPNLGIWSAICPFPFLHEECSTTIYTLAWDTGTWTTRLHLGHRRLRNMASDVSIPFREERATCMRTVIKPSTH